MRTIVKRYFYLFILLVIVVSFNACFFSVKKSNPYSSGVITNIKNLDENYKFTYSIDSVDNFRFKLYTSSGFKIFDGIFHKDSIEILYLIDDSYKSDIVGYSQKFRSKVCLNKLLSNIFRYNFSEEAFCYNAVRDSISENVCYNLYSIDYNRICRIEYEKVMKVNKKNFPVIFFITLENAEKYKVQLNN